MAGLDEMAQMKAVTAAVKVMSRLDYGAPPAVIATRAIRAGEDLYDGVDPFARIKWDTTVEALAMYEHIKPGVMERMSGMGPVERIRYCAKLAAAGNIIDFGVASEFDLEGALNETLGSDLAVDHSDRLYDAIVSSGSLLLISDNAGEIVFDRLFLETIHERHPAVALTAVVKSGPIINDATVTDAEAIGLGRAAAVMPSGSAVIGTPFGRVSEGVRNALVTSDVIISKGQGNFETSSHLPRAIYFILKAKCPSVADELDVDFGDVVFLRHTGAGAWA